MERWWSSVMSGGSGEIFSQNDHRSQGDVVWITYIGEHETVRDIISVGGNVILN
jgi:hypothetical protein